LHANVVHEFSPSVIRLIPALDRLICDDKDERAYDWWRMQAIGGAGVPRSVIPTDKWAIPRCYVCTWLESLKSQVWIKRFEELMDLL
jgi:hypothetical protein